MFVLTLFQQAPAQTRVCLQEAGRFYFSLGPCLEKEFADPEFSFSLSNFSIY